MKIPAWMDLPEEESEGRSEDGEEGRSEDGEEEVRSEDGEEGRSEDGEEEEEEEERSEDRVEWVRSRDREEWVTDCEGFKTDIYETRMRRKMCIAWMLAKEEFLRSRFKLGESYEIPHLKEKGERRREAFQELPAEGWKPSDMKRLSEISLMVWMKKIMELEQLHVMKQKHPQEKGLLQDMELRTNEKYLNF